MARVAQALTCTPEEKSALIQLSRSRSEEARLVERAKIVLLCLDGMRNDEVAQKLSIRPNTVGVWRKRFSEQGIQGLRDQARSGKPATYGPDLKSRILSQLEQSPPEGLARWDGGTLAQVLGVSDDIVWRILRKEGIQLARRRSWCVSTDPEFTQKAADMIGLYLDPPTHALVLSVDEKPTIQAIERPTGYVKTSERKDRSWPEKHLQASWDRESLRGTGSGHRHHSWQDDPDQEAGRLSGIHGRDRARLSCRSGHSCDSG